MVLILIVINKLLAQKSVWFDIGLLLLAELFPGTDQAVDTGEVRRVK